MDSTALILCPRDETLGPNDIAGARFLERPYQYNDPRGMPNTFIWIVQADKVAREKTGKSWHVWIEPNIYESLRKHLPELVNWIQGFDGKLSKFGFCEGRPMVNWPVRVPKCVGVELPHKLYRVVHDDHPWGGSRARGYGRLKTNPLTFQMHSQRHLNWACRDLSPFMSTTNSLAKARRLCAKYEIMGFTGIEVLVIRTGGPAWDNSSRIFHVQTLIKCFQLKNLSKRKYFEHEWLIENSIPDGQFLRVTLDQLRSQCSMLEWNAAGAEYVKWKESKKRKLPEEEQVDDGSRPRSQRLRTKKYAKVDH